METSHIRKRARPSSVSLASTILNGIKQTNTPNIAAAQMILQGRTPQTMKRRRVSKKGKEIEKEVPETVVDRVETILKGRKNNVQRIENILKPTANKQSKAEEVLKAVEMAPPNTLAAERILGIANEGVVTDSIGDVIRSNLGRDMKMLLVRRKLTAGLKDGAVASYVTSWLSASWRPILWSVAWSTAVTIGITLAYIYISSGSWLLLLKILYQNGIRVIPDAVKSALKSAGVPLGVDATVFAVLGLAKFSRTGQRVLEAPIPTSYIVPILDRLGIDPANITIESATKNLISQGVAYMRGDWASYLISTGISFAPSALRAGYSRLPTLRRSNARRARVSPRRRLTRNIASVVETGEKIAEDVAVDVLNANKRAIDVMKRATETIKSTQPSLAHADLSTDTLSERRSRKKLVTPQEVQVSPVVSDVLEDNRITSVATAAAATLVAVAAGGALAATTGDVSILTNAVSSLMGNSSAVAASMANSAVLQKTMEGGKMLAESSLARTAIAKALVDKVGVTSLIRNMVEYIGPKRAKRVRSIAEAIKQENNKGKLTNLSNKLFMTLMISYRDPASLKKMSKKALLEIIRKELPPGTYRKVSKQSVGQLATIIVNAQNKRANRIRDMVVGGVSSALSTVAASVVAEGAYKGYKYATASESEIKAALREAQKDIKIEEASGIEPSVGAVRSPEENARLKKVFKKAREHAKEAKQLKLKVDEKNAQALREANLSKIAAMKHKRAVNRLMKRNREFMSSLDVEGMVEAGDVKGIKRTMEDLADIMAEGEALGIEQEQIEKLNDLGTSLGEIGDGLKERNLSQKAARKSKEASRESARSKAKEFKAARKERRKLKQEETKRRFEEAVKRKELYLAEKALEDAAKTAAAKRKKDVIIVRPSGDGHILPAPDVILPPAMEKAIGDAEFTPFIQWGTKEVIKSTTSWIPGVGWVQAAIDKTNMALTVGKTAATVGKIVNVLVELDKGKKEIDVSKWETVEGLFDSQLPSLASLADDYIKTDTIKAKDMIRRKLTDKIIEGWSNRELAIEIAREAIGGRIEDLDLDMAEMFGKVLWGSGLGTDEAP